MRQVSYLSGREVEKYEQEHAKLKNRLKQIANSPFQAARSIDVAPIKKRIQQIEGILEKKSPPSLSVEKKNRLYRRLKEITAEIKDGMPTQNEMDKDTDENVEKNYRWIKRTEKLQKEYKNICRILDGYNSKLSSIETLRRTG